MNPPAKISRRTVLAGGAAAAATLLGAPVLGASGARPAHARAGTQTQLSLPPPTGPYPVGVSSLHLVDRARTDPLAPTAQARELLVRLWYPARPAWGPTAPYLPATLSGLLVGQINHLIGSSYPADLLTFPTYARPDARARTGRRPLVLFSPGISTNVAFSTGLLEDLASRGYLVAGIDHTFDALVQFPDGRVEPPADGVDEDLLLSVRVEDATFVLEQFLTATATPHGPRPDPGRVAAVGHSLGSRTAIGAIERDRRISAGAVLDGNPLGPASLGVPLLMMGNPSHRRNIDPHWAGFYDRLRGPRLHMVIDGADHSDLSDIAVFKEQIDLGGASRWAASAVTGPCGSRGRTFRLARPVVARPG